MVLVVGAAMVALHHRRPALARRVAVGGSIIVVIAGLYWFIERVFFPGGIA
jgi:hypothetical protein